MSTTMSDDARTTTEPDAPAEPAGKRRTGRWLWVVLGVLATLFLLAIAIAVFLVAAGDETATTTTAPAEVTGEEDTGATAPSDVPTRDEVVADFTAAWASADRAAMTALSNDSVAAVALDWYVDGLRIDVVEPITDVGAELLVSDPAGGSALIFTITLEEVAGSTRIADLVFGGDAG